MTGDGWVQQINCDFGDGLLFNLPHSKPKHAQQMQKRTFCGPFLRDMAPLVLYYILSPYKLPPFGLQNEWSNTKTQGFGWEVLNTDKGFQSYIHSILGSKFSAAQGILRSPVAAIERRKSTIQPQWCQTLCVSWGIINTVAHY